MWRSDFACKWKYRYAGEVSTRADCGPADHYAHGRLDAVYELICQFRTEDWHREE